MSEIDNIKQRCDLKVLNYLESLEDANVNLASQLAKAKAEMESCDKYAKWQYKAYDERLLEIEKDRDFWKSKCEDMEHEMWNDKRKWSEDKSKATKLAEAAEEYVRVNRGDPLSDNLIEALSAYRDAREKR